MDRNDPQSLVAQVFTEDGTFELGSRHAVQGRADLARMFAKTLAAFTATSHHLSNVRITFDDDGHAQATAYVYAWHRTHDGARVEAWGRYADRLVRTAQGWRIANRRIAMAGADSWADSPFEAIERLASPAELPSPAVVRR